MLEEMNDIFKSKAFAIVNPVNCVGVMGKGLALQFKKNYPQNYLEYKKHCDSGSLEIGKCFSFFENNKLIVNFPTKNHWKDQSTYSYIKLGLIALERHIEHYKIESIAIPKLGCGLGGLNFAIVKPMIVETLSKLVTDENSSLKSYEIF